MNRRLIASAWMLAFAACSHPHAIDMKAKWYMIDSQLYLGMTNWGPPVSAQQLDIVGLGNDPFPTAPEPWKTGQVRLYDLGKFTCVLPTHVRVKVGNVWRGPISVDRRMPAWVYPKQCLDQTPQETISNLETRKPETVSGCTDAPSKRRHKRRSAARR